MAEMLQLDGAHGEGGGQIIRTAVALSALTGVPVEVYNVRAGRSKPGLQAQHLTAVSAAAALCGAELRGAARGSLRFVFAPTGPVQPGEYQFDIGTAGAVSLVAQTVLVPLSHAGGPSEVTLLGGTHVPHAPPVDYLDRVYLPVLREAGLGAAARSSRPGFYPAGGGRLRLEVAGEPACRPVSLPGGASAPTLQGLVVHGGLADHVAARGAARLAERLGERRPRPVIADRGGESRSPGAAVLLSATAAGRAGGFSALGERGKPIERVADEAVADFLAWESAGAGTDEHLADQLVLPLALAAGESRWTTPRVTLHLRTVLWVTEQFLPIRWSLDEPAEGCAEVRLTGVARPN
jgi:RNA 3'-terminal phosphate cyclase (ATP)